MGFLTQVFPDRITRGMVGGGTFSTTAAFLASGREQRNGEWALPRHRYSVSQGIKTEADAAACNAFFMKARGSLHSFRFKDYTDYKLTRAESRLVQITTTTFQLCKVYGTDEPTFELVRPLTRLATGTVRVWSDATELTLGAGAGQFQVNVDTGVVTYGTAPGAAVRQASCEFYVPVRFDFNEKEAELVHRTPTGQMLIRWDSIRLIEVRE